MENLKNGDIVCVKKLKRVKIPKLAKLNIVYADENNVIVTGEILLKKNEVVKIGESQMQYEESNRYKLAQAIKKTGFSAKALSRAVAGNESYFYNKAGVARFNKKGDISDETLNLALTDLAFAEREVLGIGAKTMGDLIQDEKQRIDTLKNDVEKATKALDNFIQYQPKEKPKSINHLFIGAIIVFVFLILLILNNYFQVV